jgi:lipid II:glycine glycyltransferase (peptidoglycan interpeptide bridge formation enzyme)
MFKALGDKISIILCYLDIDKSISIMEDEINTIKGFSDITEKRKEEIKSLENKIEELKELGEKHGKKIALAGSMFIACEKELLNLYGGGFDEFMKYDAMYGVQWHAIKTAKEKGFELYNFYGIEGNFKKENNPMYGVYEFKKGFNGKVVELIGEFDLPINKSKYKFYKFAFASYKKFKNTINRIKNK